MCLRYILTKQQDLHSIIYDIRRLLSRGFSSMIISSSLSSWISSTSPALVCVTVTFCCVGADLVGRRVLLFLFLRCCCCLLLLLDVVVGAFFTCKCNTRFLGNLSRPNFCSDRFDLSSRPKKNNRWWSGNNGPNKSSLPKSSFNSPSLVESGSTTSNFFASAVRMIVSVMSFSSAAPFMFGIDGRIYSVCFFENIWWMPSTWNWWWGEDNVQPKTRWPSFWWNRVSLQ